VTRRGLAARLLARLAPPDIRAALLADLDEARARREARHGPMRARLWYARQIVSGIVPLVRMRRSRSRGFGNPPSGADLTARATFGHDVTCEPPRTLPMRETLMHDLRYAVRLLRRSPGFVTAAIATMALGIGASTAVFSIAHALLLQPLPYAEPDRLVMLWQDWTRRGGPVDEWASPGNFVDWRAERDVFESIAAIRGWRPTLTGLGDPEAIPGEQVTEDYFKVLGRLPAIGRTFTAAECAPNGPRVTVISHEFWLQRFGGDRTVLGRTLMLGGEPHEIVGIAPARFRPIVTAGAVVWRPDRLNLASPSRGAVVLRVIARVHPALTLPQAGAALDALAARLEIRFPETNTRTGFTITPLYERIVGDVRPGVLVLLAAVLFVMLVTCANLANLLLARAPDRAREVAVRSALGARRRRVVAQLLTESALLAAMGGALGVVLSVWGVQGLVAMAPAGTPRLDEIAVNLPVLGFAAALTLATGVFFGLAPAMQLARAAAMPSLRDSGRGAGAAGAGHATRRLLIVAEIAVALVLVTAGGLLLRSLISLQRTDLGFDPQDVLTAAVGVPAARYRTPESRLAFQDRLLERAAALPGVSTAALASIVPLNGGDNDRGFLIEGRQLPRTDDEAPVTWYRLVSADYFAAIDMRIERGRTFAPREAEPVVVVNAVLADRYWPGGDAIGKRVRFGDEPEAPWFTIVGIAGDVKQTGPRSAPRLQTFIPYWQMPDEAGFTNVVLETSGDPADLVGPLRHALRELDADVPVSRAAPLASMVADSIAGPRFLATLVGIFAALAALLASIGVYGVIAYAVRRRTSEIGVRLALGAGRPEVVRMVLADGMKLTAAGLAGGTVLAYFLTPLLRDLLFGVGPADPATFAGTVAALLVAALVATILPARRATRIDPAIALRSE
jgi:putative ABC transport system permease protein